MSCPDAPRRFRERRHAYGRFDAPIYMEDISAEAVENLAETIAESLWARQPGYSTPAHKKPQVPNAPRKLKGTKLSF
jgi:hypothetical protein